MVDGVGVNLDELGMAASKLADIVGGISAKELAQPLAADKVGHAAVHKAVTEFCSSIDMVAQVLVQTTEGAGNALRDAARTYAQHDDAATDPMRQVGEQIPGGR